MKNIKKYKFLETGLKSQGGDVSWKKGKWLKYEGDLSMCGAGFHCFQTIWQAFSFVQGPLLALVEVDGKSIVEDEKEVWSEMRVIRTWRWTKKDSVALAVYAAGLVLGNYEKEYPNDKRPRNAINAAKKWLRTGSRSGLSAAESAASAAASAAESPAWSAASAVWSAVWLVKSPSWSAVSTARSAVRSVKSAAWSAWSAESAESEVIKKIAKWMQRRIHNKK